MKTQVFILTLLVVISGVISKGKKPKTYKGPTWLVLTGGEKSDHSYLQSSEMVQYFGVCPNPATIPDLVPEMSEGQSVWVDGQIVFCGGTQFGANAQKICWSLKPGDSDWTPIAPLTSARALYSLTIMNIKPEQLLAVGGVGDDGACLDTMEYYNFPTPDSWIPVTKKLPEPTCGQCAVRTGKKTVMIIGGGPAMNTPTDYVWKISFMKKMTKPRVTPLQVLPVPLWRPACANIGGSVIVSGGLLSDGTASADVYKYNIKTNTWSTIGALNTARYGHVMGRNTKEHMIVAGGHDNTDYLSSIEDSYDNGNNWNPRTRALGEAVKYAAMAQVPYGTFYCDI